MSPALRRLINLSGENILIISALFFFIVLPTVLNAVWIRTPHPQQEEDLSLQINQVAELLMSVRVTARLV